MSETEFEKWNARPFYSSFPKYEEPHILMKVCIDRIGRDGKDFAHRLDILLSGTGIGGEVCWEIHKWVPGYTDFLEKELEQFNGWRAAIGWLEYDGFDKGPDQECIVDDEKFISYIKFACEWYINRYPEYENDIKTVMKKHNI